MQFRNRLPFHKKNILIGLGLGILAGVLQPSMLPVRAQMGGDSPQSQRQMQVRQANGYYEEGKFAEAESSFQELLKEYPEDAVLHYKLGNVFYRQNKFEMAIQSYQRATQLNSNYAVAYNAMGVALVQQGRTEDAIVQYRKAVEINSRYAEGLANLGQALLQKGQRTEAVDCLQRAKTLFQEQRRFQEAKQIEQFLKKLEGKESPVS